jgi:hypothetical protein
MLCTAAAASRTVPSMPRAQMAPSRVTLLSLLSCLKHRAHRARITFTGGASSSQQVTSDFGGVIDSTGHIPFPVTTDFLFETQGTQGTNHIHRWRVIAMRLAKGKLGLLRAAQRHLSAAARQSAAAEVQPRLGRRGAARQHSAAT